jgi:hypothetical protein
MSVGGGKAVLVEVGKGVAVMNAWQVGHAGIVDVAGVEGVLVDEHPAATKMRRTK